MTDSFLHYCPLIKTSINIHHQVHTQTQRALICLPLFQFTSPPSIYIHHQSFSSSSTLPPLSLSPTQIKKNIQPSPSFKHFPSKNISQTQCGVMYLFLLPCSFFLLFMLMILTGSSLGTSLLVIYILLVFLNRLVIVYCFCSCVFVNAIVIVNNSVISCVGNTY